ncbi:cytosolic protein [Myroides fluvii]|uniref:cytosolic protein n=1 Tax=Myroides fluvii TaxID=2572594 RepID=UPI00131CEF8E|nr:cytosolic protein [Myroides fluvii]
MIAVSFIIHYKKVTYLDQPIIKGIDAVYEFSSPSPKYIIAEVKMNTKGFSWWKPKLNRKITSSGGSQMQDAWIRANLEGAVMEDVYQDILINGYESVLMGVSKDNKMILESLDRTAKKIRTNINIV